MGTDFDQSTAKYVIRARIEIDGVVDKPDVVGAVFGQTEGLLGEDLDLRELQRTGRIGRIQIAIRTDGGSSTGEVVIPVSLDKTATAILAAALETVDRVGPCTAKVKLEKLEDIRGAKRRKVVSRAISILKGWEEDISPGTDEITSAVTKGKKVNVTKYGPDALPAGPDLTKSKDIIIVEGRADVINLIKCGITNTVAVEGTHVPKSIVELTKKRGKKVTAFLDGDRGGDLILRELMQVAKVDYIARAPEGREVEDLTRREITKALQAQIPADQALALVKDKRGSTGKKRTSARKPPRERREKPVREQRRPTRREPRQRSISVDSAYVEKIAEIRESFRALLFDKDKKVAVECGVAELAKTMEAQDEIPAVVFDGVVTQRLVDIADKKKTEVLIGAAVADIEHRPRRMTIATFDNVTQ
ncbi:MAG: DNA primase [Candidatus Thorarchaeota archaeon]|nr:MAG: DNA primase [Candidatus Thorarchaeota archaeon]RLI60154.1 MAG: DNA primase [Candidatus Thorarchaeota archaeon]